MKSIDLKDFAAYSQKLPTSYLLTPQTHIKPTKTSTILGTHLFDFMVCLFAATFMASIYGVAIRPFLMTTGLRIAYSDTNIFNISLYFLPLITSCYFFTSYFMNHGQTWGMHIFKQRIEMDQLSFRESSMWAVHSVVLCFSMGTLLVISKNRWNGLQGSDYLYQKLLIQKDIPAVEVMSLINHVSIEEDAVMEEIKAA